MKRTTLAALTLLMMSLCLSFASIANAQSKQERAKILEPYPAANDGMVRHVIYLSKKSDESKFKIEIVPGKVMSVDCNVHTLMGKLEEKDLQGWGYTYYEFTSDGKTASTMMACNKPNENRFVSSQSLIVRYNSKLPIVVYAPKGYEIRYRVWKAGKDQSSEIK